MYEQMYDIKEFKNMWFPDIPHYSVTYDKATFFSRDYLDCVMYILDRKANAERYEMQANLEYEAALDWCAAYGCE
jgi:hypothetical protein